MRRHRCVGTQHWAVQAAFQKYDVDNSGLLEPMEFCRALHAQALVLCCLGKPQHNLFFCWYFPHLPTKQSGRHRCKESFSFCFVGGWGMASPVGNRKLPVHLFLDGQNCRIWALHSRRKRLQIGPGAELWKACVFRPLLQERFFCTNKSTWLKAQDA